MRETKEQLLNRIKKDFETVNTESPETTYDGIRWMFNIGLGHSERIHFGGNEHAMLYRMVAEDKDAVSTFYDKDRTANMMFRAAKRMAPNFAEWVTEGSSRTRTFIVPLHSPFGKGFLQDLKERESNAIAMVFQRASYDQRDECPYGAYMKTAYPAIHIEKYSRETGVEYSREDVLNMRHIREISSARRVSNLYQGVVPENTQIYSKKNRDYSECVCFDKKFPGEDKRLRSFVSTYNISAKIYGKYSNEKLSESEFQNKYPEEYVIVESMRNSLIRAEEDRELISAKKQIAITRMDNQETIIEEVVKPHKESHTKTHEER